MVTGYYFATRDTIQNYLNKNPMRRWCIVPTDEPPMEIIVAYFDNDEDRFRWEDFPGVEPIPRTVPGGPKIKLSEAHANRLKSYGVNSDHDAKDISARLEAKFGRGMRLPDF